MADLPIISTITGYIMNEVESSLNSLSWTFPCPSPSLSQSRSYKKTHTPQPHEPATVPIQGPVSNHYTHPTHFTSTSSETKHFCLMCNEELVLSNFDRNASGNFENLCKILQLPIYEDFTPEINPFCVSCVKLMDKYFALQKKTQELISQISTLRTIMAIKVVKSFPLTPIHSQNYGVKQKISQGEMQMQPTKYILFLKINVQFHLNRHLILQHVPIKLT